MEFLNFLINLPNKSEKIIEVDAVKEERSLANCFIDDMSTIFKKIENKD